MRIAGVAILLVAGLAVVLLLFSGDSGHRYRLIFETGGQLVPGNQVQVAGQPIGTIDELSLTDNAQAEVAITVDHPLHEGTTAVVRATSLSGIANRYVSIAPGPNNAPALPEDAVIAADATTSPVDLDQLFDTLDGPTRRSLQKVIQGQATIYTGNNQAARAAYKYFAPGLQSTTRLLAELTRDDEALATFLAEGSSALGAIASRRDDLSALTENANRALGAIAERNSSLDRTLLALPPALRQANTTFVNLRAALDDLDPLVADAEVATRDLAPFLRKLRSVVDPSVPVIAALRDAVTLPGPANDLSDALLAAPGAEKAAARAVRPTLTALDDAEPNVALARAYAPDLFGLVARAGQIAGYYDANGHYVRVAPAAQNLFDNDGGALEPIPPSEQFDQLAEIGLGPFLRCPGAATQPVAGSNPFLDRGALAGECDPDDVPPGP